MVCSTTALNEFNCEPHQTYFYINLTCLLVTVVVCVLYIAVLYYRYRHRLSTSPFRYVDGYYVPKPVDIFMIGLTANLLIRTVRYTIILTDPPSSPIFYRLMNGLATATIPVIGVLAVTGITCHIPSVFVHRSSFGYRSRQNTVNQANYSDSIAAARCAIASKLHPCTIYVPSLRASNCINVYFVFLSLVPVLILSGVIGWAEQHHYEEMASILITCHNIYAITIDAMISCATIYYCCGFYRILRIYANRSTFKSHDISSEKQAARSFRNIFFALLGIKVVIWGVTMPTSILSDVIARTQWAYIAVLLIQYGVAYPAVQLVMCYSVYRNSRIQVARQQSSNISQVEKNDNIQVLTAIDYLESDPDSLTTRGKASTMDSCVY